MNKNALHSYTAEGMYIHIYILRWVAGAASSADTSSSH